VTSVELKQAIREGALIVGPAGPVDFRPRYQGDNYAWRLRGPGRQPRYNAGECRPERKR
jgi:hypothetical protein